MDTIDFIRKVIGEIRPVGDHNIDEDRYDNLKVMADVVEELLADMCWVYRNNKGHYEASRIKAAEFVERFLLTMQEDDSLKVNKGK